MGENQVQAMTYPSEEYDREAGRITGALELRYVEPLDYYQHLVNGIPVDPDTIEQVGNAK